MCNGPSCPQSVSSPWPQPWEFGEGSAKEEGSRPAPPPPAAPDCSVIIAPPNRTYIGAFPSDTMSQQSIEAFEGLAGINEEMLDIGLRFVQDVDETSHSLFNFPNENAELMSNAPRNGALFIKLEPWTPWLAAENPNRSVSLADITAGRIDEQLIAFATQAAAYGRPIFFSFGHEMNLSHYPWCGNPAEYIAAYQHVHQVISAIACNITWVWNPGVDNPDTMMEYFPGAEYVDWIALDGYDPQDQRPAAPRRTFEETFDPIISQLQRHNIPIMIGEFGAATLSPEDRTSRQPQYLAEAIDYIARTHERYANPISAFVYFNTTSTTGDTQMPWVIESSESRAALQAAIDRHPALFAGNIVTGPRAVRAAAPSQAVSEVPLEDVISGNPFRFHSEQGLEAIQWQSHGVLSLDVEVAYSDFSAGLGININNYLLEGDLNALNFTFSGNMEASQSEGQYGQIIVQITRDGDDPNNPSTQYGIRYLNQGSDREITIPLVNDHRPITKITYLFVSNSLTTQFEVTNVRFVHTDSPAIPIEAGMEADFSFPDNAQRSVEQAGSQITFSVPTPDEGNVSAGLGLMTRNNFLPPPLFNTLTFDIQGEMTNGQIDVQIFREGDDLNGAPSLEAYHINQISSDQTTITLPRFDLQNRPIRKVQFYYTGENGCSFQVSNLRFIPIETSPQARRQAALADNPTLEVIFGIFEQEAVTAPIMIDAILALIRVYNNSGEQENIVTALNIILGRTTRRSAAEPANTIWRLMDRGLNLNNATRAALNIELADAALSLGAGQAQEVIANIPQEMRTIIAGDPQLNAKHLLIQAEIALRGEENITPMTNQALRNAVLQTNNAWVILRYLRGQIDAASHFPTYAAGRAHLDESWNAVRGSLGSLTRTGEAVVDRARGDLSLYREDYDNAVAYYRAVIRRLEGHDNLSGDEQTELAYAHFGLGEIYRYGGRSRQNREAAIAQYQIIQSSIEDLPAGFHRNRLERDSREILEDFSGVIGRGFEVGSELNILCGQGTYGNTCNTQLIFNGLIPFIPASWTRRNMHGLSLFVAEQVDLTGSLDDQIYGFSTTYLGLEYDLHWGEGSSFSLLAAAGIGPFPRNHGTLPRFARQEVFRAEAYLWTQYFEAGFSAKIDDEERELDTYHLSALASLAFVNNEWLQGVRAGVVGDSYHFPYRGTWRERGSVGIDVRWTLPIVQQRNFRFTMRPEVTPYWYSTESGAWDFGIRIGIQAAIQIYRNFNIEITYNHQFDALYPLDEFMLLLEWRF